MAFAVAPYFHQCPATPQFEEGQGRESNLSGGMYWSNVRLVDFIRRNGINRPGEEGASAIPGTSSFLVARTVLLLSPFRKALYRKPLYPFLFQQPNKPRFNRDWEFEGSFFVHPLNTL